MRNILNFIFRNAHFFLFVLYLVLGFGLLITAQSVQKSYYFNLSTELTGRVQSTLSEIYAYASLREENRDLNRQMAQFMQDRLLLNEELKNLKEKEFDYFQQLDSQKIEVIPAYVVRNSITRVHNYITIDKGANQGVIKDMGVINHQGVVGIVAQVSPNYSLVISLLNSKLRLSCKIKGSNYFGSLIWEKTDARQSILEELPRHVEYNIGDTIVTSGYSSVFPEGLMVGVVERLYEGKTDNYTALSVRLSPDFGRLQDVMLISMGETERKELEAVEADLDQGGLRKK